MRMGRGVASTTEFQSIVVALLFVLVAISDRDQYLFSRHGSSVHPIPFRCILPIGSPSFGFHILDDVLLKSIALIACI